MIVCDACSLINLQKAEALQLGADMPCAKFRLGIVAVAELESDIGVQVDWQSRCAIVEPEIDAASLSLALGKFKLGPGETEALLLAKRDGYCVLSDDARARSIIRKELGGHRLAGSLGWMIHLVKNNVLAEHEAFSRYEQMRNLGAFVPKISSSDFKAILNDGSISWPCSDTCLHI